MLPPLVVIVGPTAVGKSQTAIRLAQGFDGEIISADSRQFYRGMDIGTAKVTAEEQANIPHYLIDICEPQETLTLAEFQERTYALMREIVGRSHVPFLVGGTGLYVRAVVEGYGIPRIPPNAEVRAALERDAEQHGAVALHQRLATVDPEAAAAIDPRNVRRVVRALEVYEVSGVPISVHQRRTPPSYRVLTVGLTRPREALYARADARIQAMLAAGLLDEVRALLEAGVPPESEAMTGLGYRESVAYLRGDITDEAALAQEIGRSTRRLIRTQANWFRASDPAIRWFNLERDDYASIEAYVGAFLSADRDTSAA